MHIKDVNPYTLRAQDPTSNKCKWWNTSPCRKYSSRKSKGTDL